MKTWKYIIGHVLLVLFLRVEAQVISDVPFLDSTYVWTEYNTSPFSSHKYTWRHTFSSEPTVINGINYYERLYSDDETGDDWLRTHTYYRSEPGKVFLGFITGGEWLLYDYTLEVNDSFYIPDGFGLYFIVDHIDSLQLLNGEKRKRMYMRCSFDIDPPNGWGYSEWVEGLGGLRGLYFDQTGECVFDAPGHSILCIFRNDSLIYQNPAEDSCWKLFVKTIGPEQAFISIFPNPTTDEFTISSNEQINEVQIFDITGKKVISIFDITFSMSNLPTGSYYLKILFRDNSISFRKLIKVN